MTRKDIITIAALVNAGLIIILLVSALTTKKSYFVTSSAKVAGAILKEDKHGMVPKEKEQLEKEVVMQEPLKELVLPKKEEELKVVHELPKLPVPEKEEQKFFKVVVKKGDSLEKIARRNGITVSKLVEINNLPSSFLRIGQVLTVPKGPSSSNYYPADKYYTVKAGDNPWTIAVKHNMTVKEILKLNNLDDKKAKKLVPGAKLKIK